VQIFIIMYKLWNFNYLCVRASARARVCGCVCVSIWPNFNFWTSWIIFTKLDTKVTPLYYSPHYITFSISYKLKGLYGGRWKLRRREQRWCNVLFGPEMVQGNRNLKIIQLAYSNTFVEYTIITRTWWACYFSFSFRFDGINSTPLDVKLKISP